MKTITREDGTIQVAAPCGCPKCTDRVQPGHFSCETIPQDVQEAEARGEIYRVYDGQWIWLVA